MTQADEAFKAAQAGDVRAFAEWMGEAEIPLRRSLSRLARVVDVEVVVQETLMRMWIVAGDPDRALEGENAALKFAIRVARNVALEEIRRARRDRFVDFAELESLPEGRVEPQASDPALGRMIRECIERLPEKPASALSARMREATLHDRELAGGLKMKLNTFLQNVVRARRLLRDCLERRGVSLKEILS